MKILASAAAAAVAITGIQIADKQSDVVPEEIMPESSFSEEASWSGTIEKTSFSCIFSFRDEENKDEKDKCD